MAIETIPKTVPKLAKDGSRRGGARPNSGRPRGIPNTTPKLLLEVHELLQQVSAELEVSRKDRRDGNAMAELMLRKLVALERRHGTIEPIDVPRHSRRRPLG